MKILVIEDEIQLLKNIKESLEKENFLVETAMGFETAMEKAMVYAYDCILLDIMLPNGSGLDILDELKKEGKQENVIIISAKDSLDDKLKGLDLGADDYLTKPFNPRELTIRARNLLSRTTSSTEEMPFKIALSSGSAETSREPSIRSGRGPKIRNATAETITMDKIMIILNQNDSLVFINISFA